MRRMTAQTKEIIINLLMLEYGWSRAFCVEYIMERYYHGHSQEEAIEQANEKFRLAQQEAFANADRQTGVDSSLSTGGEQK
jgi:hypothetical protein